MNTNLKRFAWLLLLLAATNGFAQLRLPSLIQSGMVLQQNDSVALWGWAGPGENVVIKTSWNQESYTTKASNQAKWKTNIKTPQAGGPYTIEISSRNTILLNDVLIGEVWVCSGQSNMEWSFNNGVKDIASVFPTAYNPTIRLFQVNKVGADFPQDDVRASWAICDSNQLKAFSAVGYFFGSRLHEALKVPIGLINASWGGTPAEAWTPEAIVEGDPELKEAANKLTTVDWWPTQPAKSYNAMIAPLTPFSIAGVIFYQGESNTGTHASYAKLFTSMIDSWRAAWKKELPFYFVQIAPFNYGSSNIGAFLREAQQEASNHPKTGMVVITDLVDTVSDIHPSRKKPVGHRLANYALATTYNKPIPGYRSPEYNSSIVSKGKLVLKFNYAENGLRVKGPSAVGFMITDSSGDKWYPAQVKLEKNTLIVWHPAVKNPAYVRYAFDNTTIGNVESSEGLPLAPFRTDHFTK